MAAASIARFLIALLQILVVLLTASIDLGGPGLSKIVRAGCMMAMVVMTSIPCIILFFVAQRVFVQGIVMSGIKG